MKKFLHKQIIFIVFIGLAVRIFPSATSQTQNTKRITLRIPSDNENRNQSPSKRPIFIDGILLREYHNGPLLIDLARMLDDNEDLHHCNPNKTANRHNISPDLARFVSDLPTLQYNPPVCTSNNTSTLSHEIDINNLCIILEKVKKLQELDEKKNNGLLKPTENQSTKEEIAEDTEDDTNSYTYKKWFS